MQLDTLRFCSRFPCKYPEPSFTTNNVLIGSSVGKKRPCWCMIADGYAGSGDLGFKVSARSSASCLVIPPPYGKKPRGIVKFLGGAFIGAVPEVPYSYLIELLAKEGYLVISVPYNVTFDHSKAANEIYEKFHGFLNGVLMNGLPEDGLSAAIWPIFLPLYSVGHRSVAATGSFASARGELLRREDTKAKVIEAKFVERDRACSLLWKANAIISYNNQPSSEAVPYFEQFGPHVKQTAAYGGIPCLFICKKCLGCAGDAFKMLFDTAGAVIAEYDKEAFVSLNKFVDQLPLVLNQVTDGVSEFRPTPRDFFKTAYNVRYTLLVKFGIDPIDEADLLEVTLRHRVESIGGTLDKIQLSGNHITPCAQEPKWQAGYLYTPADAIAKRGSRPSL